MLSGKRFESQSVVSSQPSIARFDAVPPLRAKVSAWRAQHQRIVLAPTMGALHDGHLSLMAHARKLGERVIASIFVNPTQFGPAEDLSHYPRDLDNDLRLLEEAGVDAAYIPTIDTMYPNGFSTSVIVANLSELLCGAFRPGHFSGVATVVTKLIIQCQADIAIFGEKDFQQLQVIRRVVRDLDLPVSIAGSAIVRAPDGLALSSRNRYLTSHDRLVASHLYKTLSTIARQGQIGQLTQPLIARGMATLVASGFSPIHYLTICDPDTLAPLERVTDGARVMAAAYLGGTRLIDNVAITSAEA